MSILALSETLGSLGNDIGRQVAHRLGYEFADREIIAKAAERFGESVLDLTHVTEERPTLWERFSDTRRRYLAAVEATVFDLAVRDHVVLSGRGATLLLRDVRHALRVRITAPAEVRAERLRAQQGLTAEAAVDAVRRADRERAARVRFLYGVDWDDPLLYDLVINTARVSVERAVLQLIQALEDEAFRPTAESVRRLADRHLAAGARAALLEHPMTRHLHLQVGCRDGVLTLSGSVDEEAERYQVGEIVRRLPGVVEVRNEVVAVRATLRGSPGRL